MSAATPERPAQLRGELPPFVRLLFFVALLFGFLVAIKLMGDAFKFLGDDAAKDLFASVRNPFAGLAVGILATVMVQSSSVTTATIVAMVGSRTVPVEVAVPMVMGANIGTSVANTIVAMAHMRQSKEFERAFAGATMHDFFNLLSVAFFLPIELLTSGHFAAHTGGILTEAAVQLAWLISPHLDLKSVAEVATKSEGWHSPIKTTVGAVAKVIEQWVITDTKAATVMELVTLLIVSLGSMFATLILITKNMRKLIAHRAEQLLNRVLEKSGLLGILVGVGLTVAVQSSSITTSLLVPMIAAGVLSLRNAFCITLGANIGTTVTALLAATVTGSWGLVIALVHFCFNVLGTTIIYPVPAIRDVPVRIAEKLARLTIRNRFWAVLYVVFAFVVFPLLGMLIFKD